jgi:hypothetical protein
VRIFYAFSHTFTIAKLLIYTRAAVTDSNHRGYIDLFAIVLFRNLIRLSSTQLSKDYVS